MNLEDRVSALETALNRVQLDANKRQFTQFNRDDTIFIARTFPDLNRIRVQPPAFGYVQYEEAYVEGVNVDENGVPSPEPILQLRPCARYFVLTYPPKIKINTFRIFYSSFIFLTSSWLPTIPSYALEMPMIFLSFSHIAYALL